MLVLDALKKSGRASPEAEMKAREYINLGYQRLLTFEVAGGGFDWYGKAPANVILSAWGLLEFTDMAKVFQIDTRIIDRTQKFLLGKQAADGSWEEGHATYNWNSLSSKVLQTAYVAWAMMESGMRGQEIDRAIQFITQNFDSSEKNPYVCGIVALALSKYDSGGATLGNIIQTLANSATTENGATSWKTDGTLYYGNGNAGKIEATSVVAMTLLNSKTHPDILTGVLRFITSSRDGAGSWGTTQATILALKTLTTATGASQLTESITVPVRFNGGKADLLKINPEDAEVMRMVEFRAKTGENSVEISVPKKTGLMYQIVGRYYVPWKDVAVEDKHEPVEIAVTYDRTKLAVEDKLVTNVKVKYNAASPTFMVIVDLGIPAGFTLLPDAFDKLLADKKIDKYTATGKQVTLYIGKVSEGYSLEFSYALVAKFPVKLKAPPSKVFEYYNPENQGASSPSTLEVVEK